MIMATFKMAKVVNNGFPSAIPNIDCSNAQEPINVLERKNTHVILTNIKVSIA